MASDEAQEESAVWEYELRSKKGEVLGSWVTPAEADFKWPKHGKNDERWQKKHKRWIKIK